MSINDSIHNISRVGALLAFFTLPMLFASSNIGAGPALNAACAANQQEGAKTAGSSANDSANTSTASRAKAGHGANANVTTALTRTGKKGSRKTVTPVPARTHKPIRLKIEVPCRAWVPKNIQPKVVLLCVHGLGLNSASFEEFGKQMQKEGIGAFAVDIRGFGTWMKLKGKGKCDFRSCLSDVEQALKVLHTAYPTKPIFVLGESMGGAIAMRVAADHPELVAGLISSVPSGDRFHKTKNQVNVALHLITLRGNKPIDVGTNVIEQATDDPALRAKWERDPLDRLKLTSKELLQFQRFMNDNHKAAKDINKTPVLFLVGLSDKLVKPEGSVELYNQIATEDKQLVTIRSAEHLILELHKVSPELESVLVGWLLTHAIRR